MSEDNIAVFPGTEVKLPKEVTTAEDIYKKAEDAGFKEVFVLGLDKDGQLGMVTNIPDAPTLLYLLYKSINHITK